MEREIENKIFMINDYASKNNMEEHIKEYIRKLKDEYPSACITREFYKGQNILVRATEIYNKTVSRQNIKEQENEIDDWYIRQRGER